MVEEVERKLHECRGKRKCAEGCLQLYRKLTDNIAIIY